MRITLDSTTEIGTIELQGASVPARVWVGRTDSGAPVLAFIVRIAPLSQDGDCDLARELTEAPHGDLMTLVDRAELPTTMDDFGEPR